jgi:hypothetical protein
MSGWPLFCAEISELNESAEGFWPVIKAWVLRAARVPGLGSWALCVLTVLGQTLCRALARTLLRDLWDLSELRVKRGCLAGGGQPRAGWK